MEVGVQESKGKYCSRWLRVPRFRHTESFRGARRTPDPAPPAMTRRHRPSYLRTQALLVWVWEGSQQMGERDGASAAAAAVAAYEEQHHQHQAAHRRRGHQSRAKSCFGVRVKSAAAEKGRRKRRRNFSVMPFIVSSSFCSRSRSNPLWYLINSKPETTMDVHVAPASNAKKGRSTDCRSCQQFQRARNGLLPR